jgi:ParB family chromosome partitioning protein
VANTVRLLNLPAEIKEYLGAGKISEGHARVLLSLKQQEDQLKALDKIVNQNLNVRQTEAYIRQLLTQDQAPKPKRAEITPQDKDLQSRFESRLGTRVELRRTDDEAGKITIHFYSREELQAIFNAIIGEDEQL